MGSALKIPRTESIGNVFSAEGGEGGVLHFIRLYLKVQQENGELMIKVIRWKLDNKLGQYNAHCVQQRQWGGTKEVDHLDGDCIHTFRMNKCR